MCRIRFFEESMLEQTYKGNSMGVTHPSDGQEAVPTGICAHLTEKDWIGSTHRGHGHCIAKGLETDKMMAEIMGKYTGNCKGKGGSMHIADFSKGMLGANAIVGASIPLAVGAALTAKYQGKEKDSIGVAFFGDGASSQGVLHESMNLASIWKLPVIFACENNQYAITNSYENSVAVDNVSDRAVAYNMPGILVDGQNVEAMYEATSEAVKRARNGEGPTLIEGLTYRFEEHSLGLGKIRRGEYRDKSEIDKWRERDPIDILTKKLIDRGILTNEDCKKIENNSRLEIEEAVNFARKSEFPGPDDLFEGMWANPIPKP